MDVGVQIGDADIVADDGIFEARLGLSIVAAAAPSIISIAVLFAVAIDVHIDELFAVAVQVDDAGC